MRITRRALADIELHERARAHAAEYRAKKQAELAAAIAEEENLNKQLAAAYEQAIK